MRLCLLLLTGCAIGSADDSRPTVESGSCWEAREEAERAWEWVMGPISQECLSRLDGYEVEVGTWQSMPDCGWTPKPGKKLAGCTRPSENRIYILDELTDEQLADVAPHEWTHAINACENGDTDGTHLIADLWGPGGVEELAKENTPLGPCL